MSHQVYRIRLLGLSSVVQGLLVGCAYPALSMGSGAGGTATTPSAGGAATTPSAGGAATTPSAGGAATTAPGNGGATTAPGSGGAVTTISGSGGAIAVTFSSGGTTSTAKGGSVGSGGVVTTVATGGSASTTGGAGAPAECLSTTNLIALAMTNSTTGNWVGNDPAIASDNPCGIQGAIFAYSDNGLDNVPGGVDATVQSPAIDATGTDPNARLSPCSNGKCCISGTTHAWPLSAGVEDFTASVWGGGIGLALNAEGSGVKLAYSGPVKGFNLRLSGTLNGQVVRFMYTQTATDVQAPIKQISSLGVVNVPFTGVTCPTWFNNCLTPGLHPYDLEVQIVGGDWAGPFSLCIDSITPIL